jgi:protein TonB
MKNIFSAFNGPDFGPNFTPANDKPYLFVIASVIIHALVLFLFINLPEGTFDLLAEIKKKPLDIEIVQLPDNIPFAGKLKTPDKITAYAQRSQAVEKEEYPMESGRGVAPTPPNEAALPRVALHSPATIGDGDGEAKAEERQKPKERAPLDDNAITFDPKPVEPAKESATAESGEEAKTGAKTSEGLSLMPTDTALHQIAREESNAGVESPKEGSGMTLLLNTSDFRFQKYFIAVKRRIEFFWDYPPLAARKGQQGRLKIDFVIQKDGTLRPKDIEIIKSSNYPILDDAATTALRLASPFNPFPDGFDLEEITVHGSFEYNLYRGR